VFGVYGGSVPTRKSLELIADLRGYDRNSTVSCLARYLAYGWTGIVPAACRNTFVVVPANYAWALWGWPYRFAARMRQAGSEIILLGPYGGGGFSSGIDTIEQLDLIPANFDGYVWTNRIETVGPALSAIVSADPQPKPNSTTKPIAPTAIRQ
jgi:glycerophosphoryl diester phosphodiesterase